MGLVYYKPKNFCAEEFVPPRVFHALGAHRVLLVMDLRILITADAIRDYFGRRVTINNWKWGGDRTLSGFRPADTPIGALWSQHKFGRAIDCLVDDVPAEEARQAILANRRRFPLITVIEDDVSWLHVDCRPTSTRKIELIKP